jgi:putative ABC transport system substrate-binding protein
VIRRRDFTIGLLLGASAKALPAQEQAKQHRIAFIAAGPVARIHDPEVPATRTFWDELRRLGHVEGENLTVDAYSGGGRPERYADLAHEVVNRNPEVIVASTDAIARAVRGASGTIPIVWIGGDPITAGLAVSLARPGGNITGVTVNAGDEIWGKRLQILKEAVPSASKVALLTTRTAAPSAATEQLLRDATRRLQISLMVMPVEQSTPSEIQRVFASSLSDLCAIRPIIW